MFRLLSPVPGILIDPSTPDFLALRVSCNGPSLIDLVNDLIPCSVMLNPATVRSKFNGNFSVIFEFGNELFKFIFSTSN
jgi:hypothetical protein